MKKYSGMSMGNRIRLLVGLPESEQPWNDNELLFPQLDKWRNRKCSCKGAATIYGPLPQGGGEVRCLECFGLFDSTIKSVEQATDLTREDYLGLKYAIEYVDEQARARCHCWDRRLEDNILYKIGSAVYCRTCGRIAGYVVLQ